MTNLLPNPNPMARQHYRFQTRPQTKTSSYDQDSGLIYDEVEVSAKPSSFNWVYEYKTPSIAKTKLRPNDGQGAHSLVETILRKLQNEAQDLTVEALQSLPWSFGRQIWHHVISSHTESFYLWRTFATAYGKEFGTSEYRYLLDIKASSLPLIDYFKGITSPERRWLTCLRISPKQVTAPDLVNIASISNLGILDLSDGQLYIEHRVSTFDNRILRTWSELARDGRAFTQLRVLMLGWQEKVDVDLFNFLDSFVKLNILILSDCRLIHHKNHKEWEDAAWKHGWQFMPSKRGVKHLRSLMDDRTFQLASISNLYEESLRTASNEDPPSDKLQHRPLLECWLGTAKPWVHIIDEFPGTKTVFLYKSSRTKIPQSSSQPVTNQGDTITREPALPKKQSHPKRSPVEMKPRTKRKPDKRSAASLLKNFS